MTKNVLAFDLGASSGRGMLARFDGEKITLEEVHRFPHNFSMLNGHAYWNLLHLMDEMKNGLRKSGKDLSGVGFDTWGVDCGFLSREGDLLAMPGSYRDPGLDDANMREALIALDRPESQRSVHWKRLFWMAKNMHLDRPELPVWHIIRFINYII